MFILVKYLCYRFRHNAVLSLIYFHSETKTFVERKENVVEHGKICLQCKAVIQIKSQKQLLALVASSSSCQEGADVDS